ncbi:MAG: rhomboid family intramembrane serine protease [Proteobacteria bacterium]|nr:rhomboid family intramembrane serine protease [Pseudomonadota bacterium]MBU1709619.1 rhomboid family intramembrane serine protease [Pseudomonadota bacterium]
MTANSDEKRTDILSFPLDDAGQEEGQAYLWSLVLSAADIPHILVRSPNGWAIKVEDEFVRRANQEIIGFEKENAHWPPPKHPSRADLPAATHQSPTILIIGALIIFYGITGPWASGSAWFSKGSVSGYQILENGQWWRLATALTLHADPVHILGNTVIGGIMVHFLLKMFGAGLGISLIMMSGIIGNFINILLQGGKHNSVGFSTAVFGAIGILAGFQMFSNRSIKGVLLPLGAGLSLLAMLGTEGEHTDVGAHLWGLVAGVLIGFIFGFFPRLLTLSEKNLVQAGLFSGCVVFFVYCWRLALGQ